MSLYRSNLSGLSPRWTALFIAVSTLSAGCMLEEIPATGPLCPPGILAKGEDNSITFDSLTCYEESFVVSKYPLPLNTGKDCCDEEDSEGSLYRCRIRDDCRDVYKNDIRNDYALCEAYNAHDYFKTGQAFYTKVCDDSKESSCKAVENAKETHCPAEYDYCLVLPGTTDFACVKDCKNAGGVYCKDSSTEEQGNICVYPLTDTRYCGAAGSCSSDERGDNYHGETCQNGQICIHGECKCPHDVCDDHCVDFQTDPDHCGDCDTECGSDEICSRGVCAGFSSDATCAKGGNLCGSACIDCTALPNVSPDGVSCSDGVCQIEQCSTNYHLSKDKKNCLPNTAEACGGPHSGDDVVNCLKTIDNGVVNENNQPISVSEDVYCNTEGKCKARKCNEKYPYSLRDGVCTSVCKACENGEGNKMCNEEKTGCICQEGFTTCYIKDGNGNDVDDECVNLLDDDKNCGACGHQCENGQKCSQAQCG